MNIEILETFSCEKCGGTNFNLEKQKHTNQGNKSHNIYNVMKCSNCGQVLSEMVKLY